MSIRAERVEERIQLTAPMILKDRAAEVPGGRYIAKDRAWYYPLSWAHCVMLRGVFGDELEVGPELTQWATEELRRRITPALQAREAKE